MGTAPVITGWWRGRGKAERFDLYTRVPLYVLSGLVPLPLLGTLWGEPGRPLRAVVAVLAVAVAHTVACLAIVHIGLSRVREPGPVPVRLIAVAAGLTLAGVVVAGATGLPFAGPGLMVALILALAFIAAVSVVVPLRVTGALVLLVLVAPLGLGLVFPGVSLSENEWAAWVISLLAASVGALSGYRGSAWMLGIVWELDRARGVQSRLAVAEERLRFSRDLHDVVGRGLSVIAVKSELAAQWAKRGRAEAADEMLEVRRVAQDLLIEVREVVRGYRMPDLDAELAGARAVLVSAGVDCQVIGDHPGLPVDAQGALGWVVREGITNVLRHSDATTCTVSVCTVSVSARPDGARVVLAMENDGVRDGGPLVLGSGLQGLTERLAPLGGTVVAEHRRGDRFRLTAELPA